MEEIRKVAIEAAKKAGDFLINEYEKFDRSMVQFKSHKEIVSSADLQSEQIILSEIKKHFPDHAILSEESGSNHKLSAYMWVVDPIDGSTNFSMHNPIWSISIGLAKNGELILGVVYAPILKEMFIAIKGEGATLNGKPITVSRIPDERAIHAFCHAGSGNLIDIAMRYATRQKKAGVDCRQLGSAAIECGYVASGRMESIVIPGAKPWDVAAGVLLVREAGGMATDFSGNEWNLKSPNEIAASNGLAHENILKIIQSE